MSKTSLAAIPAASSACSSEKLVRPSLMTTLAVENGLPGKIEGTGNHGEPFGPVQAVAGEDLALALFRWIWTR